MRIFDSDGAPLSYEHLGRIAPEPPAPTRVTGRAFLEIPFAFETTATDEDGLRADFLAQHSITEADTVTLEMDTE